MKIALVSAYDFPYPGGVTEHIMALATGAQQRGHEVQVLAACSGYQGETFPHTKVVTRRVVTIPIGGTVARVGVSPLSYLRVKHILQREAFDVIHLHEPLTPGITWSVLWHARRLPYTGTIGTFHAYHDRPNWLYVHSRPIFGQFFARLDSLIAVSEAARDFAEQMFPGDYRIIPNGIDLNRFSRVLASGRPADPAGREPKVTLLFVGRLDQRKGFLTLLESFIKLKPDYPQLHLKVVGPFGPRDCEPYRQMIRRHGVTNVEFVGYVTPDKLPTLYHSADIFCAPSLGFESFGIVLLEAMAAGLPIVASNIAGYRSLISEGQEGLLAAPGQVLAWVQALRHLLDEPRRRQAMGRCGQLKARQYSWDDLIDQILDVYLDTLERKRAIRGKNPAPSPEASTSSNYPIQRRQTQHVKRSSTQI